MNNKKMEGSKMKKWLSAFLRDEEGASGIEYALVAAMVAIALVTFIEPINQAVGRIFSDIKETLEKASPTGP
ncbi:MAG: Flp family type IVb pilin [Methylobacter sp.]|uniref:Flp family type IVb pilin n=1 Tax=Methylobacter sp. TaxID=2051955 RepID=UPI00258EC767|nr:Flp family type IVb pilin [Methylobacter sp.]MCL7421798.1 Flp family type IVb pilin [Methylobacter sp.]